MNKSTIFPDLGKHKITRLVLSGCVAKGKNEIHKYWNKNYRIKNQNIINFEGNYQILNKQYFRRLCFYSCCKKHVQFIIDISNLPLSEMPRSGQLSDKIFLDFCKWSLTNNNICKAYFSLDVIFKFPYSRKMDLPFDPFPKTGSFLTGMRFGFDKKDFINDMTIEKVEKNICVVIKTKPFLGLDPNKFNNLFFSEIINTSTNIVHSMIYKEKRKNGINL